MRRIQVVLLPWHVRQVRRSGSRCGAGAFVEDLIEDLAADLASRRYDMAIVATCWLC